MKDTRTVRPSSDLLSLARKLLSGLILLIAGGVLLGWFLHIAWLKSVIPGLATMKVNTALGLMAGGVSVTAAGSDRPGRRMCVLAGGLLMGAIGALTLIEYATGARLGVDELIAADPDIASAPFNGRMSPATAVAFVGSGVSLGFLAAAHARWTAVAAHLSAAVPAAIGLLALAGYAYGVGGPGSLGLFASLALHTSLALSLMAVAILLTRRAEGWERPFLGRPIARAALLRVLLVSVLVPFFTGLVVVWGSHRGLYQAAYAPALFAFATAAALIMLAFQSAGVLAKAEAALLEARRAADESDQQLQLALSSGRGVGTWEWNVVEDRVVADERFARLYGVDPERAKQGAPLAEFVGRMHPDDLPWVQSAIGLALRTGEQFTAEYRLVQADGTVRWVLAEGRCQLGRDGSPQRFPGVAIDITERRAAEARRVALLLLTDRLRDLTDPSDIAFEASRLLAETLQVSRVGYGLVDKVAETISIERDWNAPGVASLVGKMNFREYGSYIEDLKRGETVAIADADRDPRARDTAQALIGIDARAFVNMPLVEQGGFVALLFVTNTHARDWSPEEIVLMREVAERVRVASERARAEAARRRSEEQFRVFAQTVPSQVWASRADGFIYWYNAQVYAYTGDAPGALDGTEEWGRSVHPEDLAGAVAAWGRSLSTGEVYEAEFRIRRADGAYRWFLAQAEPVRADGGEIVGWVGANTDIDERRRQAAQLSDLNANLEAQVEARTAELMAAEEQLRQSQKMEAVGQLTGGLAHDFNNLLTGITGSLEMLSTRIAQGRINDIDRYATAAQGAAKRAAALTHRLLAFSRRQTLDPRPTDANRLIAGMEDLIRRTVGPAVQVEVIAAGGLWPTLVDPNQLENALLNLCINARDAMPEGGRLTVETGNKWLDDRAAKDRDLPPGQYVTLCVSDTGTGMTPDVAAKAFDPFFTTKPIGQGTGLGLSMIYGFVRQSGGQVRIYSEPAQGALVCLYLPRHLGEAEAIEAPAGVSRAPRAETGDTVLVVDDEPTVRMLVTEVLEELGYAAIEAADAAAGLRVLESNARVDFLVTDVGLPGGMNGRQMADAARVHRPDLKVLFITGYAENAVVGNGHLEPGMHVMTKPFAMEALANRIRDLIAGR